MNRRYILIPLIIFLCFHNSYTMQLAARRQAHNQQEALTHHRALPSAQEALNTLMSTTNSPDTQQLLNIVCKGIMSKIEQYTYPTIKKDLCSLVLPRINVPNLTLAKKTEVYNELARAMVASDEFMTQFRAYLPTIEIEPGHLGLEQVMHLFFACKPKLFTGRSSSSLQDYWVLCHRCFATLPVNIKQELIKKHLEGCKGHICVNECVPLSAVMGVVLILVSELLLKALGKHNVNAVSNTLNNYLGIEGTGFLIIAIVASVILTPSILLSCRHAKEEVRHKFKLA